MKAVVCTKYGPPEVLQCREVEQPVPKDNEVLIRIRATTVTAGDVLIRGSAYPTWFWLAGRILYGIWKPRRTIPGNELAGQVESVGKDVKQFRPGDEVFGIVWETSFGGAYAEYKCLREDGVALKPRNMTFEEAATVPIGGLTALHLLKKGNITAGQKVLIYGASGSVGTFAVQLARYFGAEVTGVCSGANMELVRSLGAENVIDYTTEDFLKNNQSYDIIFDAVIKTSFERCSSSLRPNGTYITVDFPLATALWTSVVGDKKLVFGMASQIEELSFLRELIEAGKIRSVIDRSYPLEQAADAHKYVDAGHKRGNVPLVVK